MSRRKILRIDREKCSGCGLCASACAEGAIEIRDGKAVLVRDSYCDGLGACIGECPAGALQMEERDAEDFDEHAVADHLEKRSPAGFPAPCACPSAAVRSLKPETEPASAPAMPSQLSTWPVQLMLVPVGAPFLSGADLLLAADCTAFASADFHKRFLKGRVALVGCPKLDDARLYLDKLTDIFAASDLRSLEVVYMQVPCCSGLVRLAREARQRSGASFPMRLTRLSVDGQILESTSE
jgi:Pyruvate/2-oxoacid:ferredoxin oxidoreductase delta subunit